MAALRFVRLMPDDPNFGSLFDMFAVNLPRALGDPALPSADYEGDKRIISRPMARRAAPSTGCRQSAISRSNMVRGGAGNDDDSSRPANARSAQGSARICATMGLILVGIDVIDGNLTEINVTSPTAKSIRAIANLGGPDLAVDVWESIEAKRSAGGEGVLMIDPALFKDEAIAPETRALNAEIVEKLSALPDQWSFPHRCGAQGAARGARAVSRPAAFPARTAWIEIDARPGRSICAFLHRTRIRAAVYLHIHGGGWTWGSPDEQESGIRAPRRAGHRHRRGKLSAARPEKTPYPAAPDDCEAAALWLLREAQGLFGHAGADDRRRIRWRASCPRHHAAPARPPRAEALCRRQPLRWLLRSRPDTEPLRKLGGRRKLILNARDITLFALNLCGDQRDRADPDLSPLLADLAGLPPVLGEHRHPATRSSTTASSFAARLATANVPIDLAIYPGGCHMFQRFGIPLSEQALTAGGRVFQGAGGVSDCLSRQASCICHGVLSRMIALRMVRSFLAVATSATIFGLALCDELVAEGLERGICGGSRRSAPKYRAVRTLARPPPMKLLPRQASGLARPGREPGEGGDGAPVEGAELGQLGDKSAGDDGADTGHGGEEVLLPRARQASAARLRRCRRRGCRVRGQAPSRACRCSCAPAPARRRGGWRSEVIMADASWRRRAYELGEQAGLRVLERPDLRRGGLDEVRDHGGVDGVRSSPACRARRQRRGPGPG